MKSLAISILLISNCFFLFAQNTEVDSLKIYYNDSVTIEKHFVDASGENTLQIKVINPCGIKNGPFDGVVTYIRAVLKSKASVKEVFYNYPEPQSGLIYLNEKDISVKNIDGSKAVFIPFFYCGNWDNDIKVSYIIFYKKSKYLLDIKFYCNEDMKCRLNDNLTQKLKKMPGHLKAVFIQSLKMKYKKASDFYKN